MNAEKLFEKYGLSVSIFSPIVLFAFTLLVLITTNINYKNLITSSYRSHLNTICENTENSIQSAIDVTDAALSRDYIASIMQNNPSAITSTEIKTLSSALSSVSKKYPLIDSIHIFNRSKLDVYDATGTFSSYVFFNNYYKYESYSLSYWSTYSNFGSAYRILPPTIVHSGDNDKLIIPIILNKIDNKDIRMPITINIDGGQLLENLNRSKLTDKSFFQLYSKTNKCFFDSSAVSANSYNDRVYTGCFGNDTFKTYINKRKYIVVSYTRSSSMFGYSYVAFIPSADITAKSLPIIVILIVIGILICISTIYILRRNYDALITPAKNVINRFRDDLDENSPNPISNLVQIVDKISSERNVYLNQIKNTLSPTEESKIISLLNQNNTYTENMMEFLIKDDIDSFEYDYFSSVVINMEFSEKFYADFPSNTYKQCVLGIKEIIRAEFINHGFLCYDIPCNISDTTYFLLNIPSGDENIKIHSIIDSISESLLTDREYLKLNVSCGDADYGIKGLINTHKSAMAHFSNQISTVQHSLDLTGDSQSLKLHSSEESALIRRCLLGQTEETYSYVENLLLNSIASNSDYKSLIAYNKQILEVLLGILRMKNPDYKLSDESDSTLVERMAAETPEVLSQFIHRVLEIIGGLIKTNSTVDISMITTYINAHCTDSDICLTSVAETFALSPKYLSKKFKEQTGVRFVEYLTTQRVLIAEKLLRESDLSIAKISAKSGYTVLTTFIHAFKSQYGKTPTEYRNELKKEN